MDALKPVLNGVSILGLLFTLIVMFALKGDLILERPGIVARDGRSRWPSSSRRCSSSSCSSAARLRFPYRDAVAVAFNATGRDFEIAIAIAITAFSPTVALATVVGPLIEVPVMLVPRLVGDAPGAAPVPDRAAPSPRRSAVRADLPVLPGPRLDLSAPDVARGRGRRGPPGDRTRAGILRMLRDGPHCVCEMAAALGERENNVSNHLARLREAGLVRASRHDANARFQYYERDEAAIGSCGDAIREVLG